MSKFNAEQLEFLSQLVTKILAETVEQTMIVQIEKSCWPKEIVAAVEKQDETLADDVDIVVIREVVINALIKLCHNKLESIYNQGTLPLFYLPVDSLFFRIQELGFSSAIFYGRNSFGRYNCPNGTIGVLYCAQYPDTCLAEITEREEMDTKGKGPSVLPTMRKPEWFENKVLAITKSTQPLKLVNPAELLTVMSLSGQLTSNSYLWTQAIVAALLKLPTKFDGIIYDSAHHRHGVCFALFEPENKNMIDVSQAILNDSVVSTQLVTQSQFTRSRGKLKMTEVFVKILGGMIVPTE